MSVLVTDQEMEQDLKAERKKSGADRWDEVWDGVYVMPTMPDTEHQKISVGLSAVYQEVVGWSGLADVFAGVNISDREEDWKENYRIPDVAVFLKTCQAIDCGSHWFGGPDHGVEIVSPGDRSRDKLDFYASVGVRELLLIDRYPWALELYQLRKQQLVRVGRSTPKNSKTLKSIVLPLTLRLVAGRGRPTIEVRHADDDRR